MLEINAHFENTGGQIKQICGPKFGQFTTFEINRHIVSKKGWQFMICNQSHREHPKTLNKRLKFTLRKYSGTVINKHKH